MDVRHAQVHQLPAVFHVAVTWKAIVIQMTLQPVVIAIPDGWDTIVSHILVSVVITVTIVAVVECLNVQIV